MARMTAGGADDCGWMAGWKVTRAPVLSRELKSIRGSRILDCAWLPGIGFQRADIHAARTRQVAVLGFGCNIAASLGYAFIIGVLACVVVGQEATGFEAAQQRTIPAFVAEAHLVSETFLPNQPTAIHRVIADVSFAYSNGWWEVQAVESDQEGDVEQGYNVTSCMRIPEGVRLYTARTPTCQSDALEHPGNDGRYLLRELGPQSELLSELTIWNNGTHLGVDVSANGDLETQVLPFPAPYDRGFEEMIYRVIETTNLAGITFPARASYIRLSPAFDPAIPDLLFTNVSAQLSLKRVVLSSGSPTTSHSAYSSTVTNLRPRKKHEALSRI